MEIQATDFYEFRCTIYINGKAYIAEYFISFTDEDYNFDSIEMQHIYKFQQFSMSYNFTKPLPPRREVFFDNDTVREIEEYLYDNYYEEIQDGFMRSVFDDMEADNYKDLY